MTRLLGDIRYAFRQFGRNPGFTAAVVITLSLGIGASTSIFSVVEAVLLRKLPYPQAKDIVLLQDFNRKRAENPGIIGVPRLQDVVEQNRVFSAIAYYFWDNATLALPGKLPERIAGSCVSGRFWDVMGVRPLLGGTFDESGDTPHSQDYVVLSYGLWRRLFSEDRGVVGRAVILDGQASTVLGVMPPAFDYPPKTEFWRTSHFPLWQIKNRDEGSRFMAAIARLKPGFTLTSGQSELDVVSKQLAQQYNQTDADWLFRIKPVRDGLVEKIRPALLVLMAAVLLVLLIACANVINLLISRAVFRQREVAIRQAVGASNVTLLRQFLTEGVILSVIGGCLGLASIAPFIRILVSRLPEGLLQSNAVRVNFFVLVFAFAICVLTGVSLGLAPAVSLLRRDLQSTLKHSETQSITRSSHRFRGFMVATEVGLSLVLLIGAGLMIETFWKLQQVTLGFSPNHVLTFTISFPWGSDHVKLKHFYQSVVEGINAIPGVEAAGTITSLPLQPLHTQALFWTSDKPRNAMGGGGVLAETRNVSGDYFKAMGIPLMAGRFFTAHDSDFDTGAASGRALISKTFADQYFPSENPIGKVLQFDGGSAEIVGVIGNVRTGDLEGAPKAEVYWPDSGWWPNNQFAVRSSVAPQVLIPAIREQVRQLDPNQAIHSIATMDTLLDDAVAQPRLNMFLLASFAGLALVLAAIGLYGVIAYLVAERTREIALRMALGAQAGQVLRLFLRQGMRWALIGAAGGLIVAFVLVRFVRSMLFEVAAYDPRIFASVIVLLAAIALLASYLPARRATKVDPMVALRYE